MSGIADIYRRHSPTEVEQMFKKIQHRGPDGQGVQDLARGTVGQRQLALINTEGHHLPMEVAGAWIIFNGEIYTYRELAREHRADKALETLGDLEVLVRPFNKYGTLAN